MNVTCAAQTVPRFVDAIAAILLRADLLRARVGISPSRSPARPRSCDDCGVLGVRHRLQRMPPLAGQPSQRHLRPLPPS